MLRITSMVFLLFFGVLCFGCGGSQGTKNSDTEFKKFITTNLPSSIDKVDKTKTGPIFTKDLENVINYKRKDKDNQLYVNFKNAEIVNVYTKPSVTVDKENFMYKKHNVYMGEVGDRKVIDGVEWYYIRAFFYKEGTKGNVIGNNYGWIKNDYNLKVDTSFSQYYCFDGNKDGSLYSMLQTGYKNPEYLKKDFNKVNIPGNFRHIYTYTNDGYDFESCYLDMNSIRQEKNEIFFDVLNTRYFQGREGIHVEYVNKKPVGGVLASKVKYVYDTQKQRYVKIGGESFGFDGKKLSEYVDDQRPYYSHLTTYLSRDANGVVSEFSSLKPEYTRRPEFIYTALFKVLEGE